MSAPATVEDLAHLLQPLLAAIGPAGRRKLARDIAKALRSGQARRIKQQRNPDGSAYTPRKPQPPRRIKQQRDATAAMFAKLRTAQHLRTEATPQSAAVMFLGRVARIARIHQEGLEDAVEPAGPVVRYARRELLGFTPEDLDTIKNIAIGHLAGGASG